MRAEINEIATSSIQEGLDFACHLLSNAIAAAGHAEPAKAVQLLDEITNYIQFRYAGEDRLALESLSWLGHMCDVNRHGFSRHSRAAGNTAFHIRLATSHC